jgi:hypothetical protein
MAKDKGTSLLQQKILYFVYALNFQEGRLSGGPTHSIAKKAAAPSTAKRIARSAATGKLADRVIYHSPLEPRHLTRSQIKAIVAKDRP